MIWWIIAALVAVGVVVVFQLRSRTAGNRERRPPPRGVDTLRGGLRRDEPARPASTGRPNALAGSLDGFQGSMVMPQQDCCEAVLQMRGQLFPPDRTITVPVKGCDRPRCKCQIHRVAGRRRAARRSQPDRRGDVRFTEDRRSGRDRRRHTEVWSDKG